MKKGEDVDRIAIIFIVFFLSSILAFGVYKFYSFGPPQTEYGYICDVNSLNDGTHTELGPRSCGSNVGGCCYGDADGNGFVNTADRGFVAANIGFTDSDLLCLYDIDGNGFVNAGDRGFVAANINLCSPLPSFQDGSGNDPRFPRCGDRIIQNEHDEDCDDGNSIGGDGCSALCRDEVTVPICGDGVIQGFEICDCGEDGVCTSEELNEQTCTSFNPSYTSGELGCTASCQFLLTECIESCSFNSPPTATPRPINGRFVVGIPAQFDGSLSTDPHGFVVTYFWEFGDGSTFNSDSPLASHTYNSIGTYQVRLTTTDNCGATRTSFVNAFVYNPPSEPRSLSVSAPHLDNSPSCSSASVFWQPPSYTGAGISSYNIYVDGYLSGQTISLVSGLGGLLGETTYKIEVSAIDSVGQESERSEEFFYTTPRCEDAGHLGIMNIKAILLKLPGHEETAITPEHIRGILSDYEYSFSEYINEVSYGRMQIQLTDVLGWYQLSGVPLDYCQAQVPNTNLWTRCNKPPIYSEALSLSGLPTPSANERYIIYLVGSTGGEVGDTGYFILNGGESYWVTVAIPAHELGHTLGLRHSGKWSCPSNLVGPEIENLLAGGCSVSTYGDEYDSMGVKFSHYNSLQKYFAGFLLSSQIQTISQSGEYVLGALETNSPDIKQIRVSLFWNGQQSQKTFYFLEYRKPIGVDSLHSQNAPDYVGIVPAFGQMPESVQIRLYTEGNHEDSISTYYINKILTPENSQTVPEESIFCDPYRNIEIELLEFLPNDQARVRITYDSDCE